MKVLLDLVSVAVAIGLHCTLMHRHLAASGHLYILCFGDLSLHFHRSNLLGSERTKRHATGLEGAVASTVLLPFITDMEEVADLAARP